jgi:hypothetical protein
LIAHIRDDPGSNADSRRRSMHLLLWRMMKEKPVYLSSPSRAAMYCSNSATP